MAFRPGKGALANLVKGGLDDDDEAIYMIVRAEFEQNKQQERCMKWFYERLDWDWHVEKLRHTKGFEKRYHMTEESFITLVNILR